MRYLIHFLLTMVSFLLIDFTWLGLIAKSLYDKYIGQFLLTSPNFLAAFLFYGLYVFGLIYLIVLPQLKDGDIQKVLINGAVFGLVAYATYDLTNLATHKDWPIQIVIVDLIWGTFLTATTAAISFYIAKYVLNQ